MTLTPQDTTIILILVLVLIAVVIIAIVMAARRRSERLQARFGTEYDTAVQSAGSQSRAENELTLREKRRAHMDIHPLPDHLRSKYLAEWKALQGTFVDDPRGALQRADTVLHEVMEARGYPTRGFAQEAADLSVDYGDVVADYRKAHAIALESEENRAGIEDLRRGVVLYRSLFERLLDIGSTEKTAVRIDRESLEAAIRRQAS